MHNVIFSSHAEQDVKRLYAFLKTKNPAAAKRAVQSIHSGAGQLSTMPYMGKVLGEDDERREWFVPFGNAVYVLRYVIIHSDIVILRVWYSREHR